ncbi:MAG: EamA family transporter [Lachnospiraceae bacterium]|nr:EamA family transporter [Lachnospiraceae bacterium]
MNNYIYVGIFLISVFVSSVSQILLKISAGKTYDSKIKEYLNAPVIIAYGLFFLSTVVTVLAYKYVDLSLGPVLEATGYIWVTLLGYLILKEKVSRKKLLGLVVIIVGIIVFNVNI